MCVDVTSTTVSTIIATVHVVIVGVVEPPVVDAAVVVEFPPLPPLGSRHEHSIQY